ncbi:MAG: RHS repeat-associated core domain-containing protein [Paludibacteraceae bacterium]|nr:RHS repeat-associated core domain-containing protein [Paludibacteraceae bacterium]
MTVNRSDIGYAKINFFYHPDHLGSTSMVTDAEGYITQNVSYIPYGEVFVEERNGVWNTPYLFNAKELDGETGLYYYGARYLNPKDTRWMSVDPLFEKYVGMSPYGYCAGNPVRLVDVDGRRTFNVTNEDGTTQVKEINGGINKTYDIMQFDFALVQWAFDSDESSDKSDYNAFVSRLSLDTKGYQLAVSARSFNGKTGYGYEDYWNPNNKSGKNTWKCNKFVYDRLKSLNLLNGYNNSSCPPQAGTYFNLKNNLNGSPLIGLKAEGSETHLGDVIEGSCSQYQTASGHVEIVTTIYPKGYNNHSDNYFLSTGAHYDLVTESSSFFYKQYGDPNNNNTIEFDRGVSIRRPK